MSIDAYVRLAKPANPPRDLSHVWANLDVLEEAPEVVLSHIDWWARSKGSSLPTLARMNVRYRVNRHGGVHIAYAVRCAETEKLEPGTVVGIKFRDLDSEAPRVKFCAPGTRLKYPALPTLYGNPEARRVFVCEGESDAAWLLERCDNDGAVLCLHGGAALFACEWLGLITTGIADAGTSAKSWRSASWRSFRTGAGYGHRSRPRIGAR
jgi:hypothetical protein